MKHHKKLSRNVVRLVVLILIVTIFICPASSENESGADSASASTSGGDTGAGSAALSGGNSATGSGSTSGGDTGADSAASSGGNSATGSGSTSGGDTGAGSAASSGGNSATSSTSDSGGDAGTGSVSGENSATGSSEPREESSSISGSSSYGSDTGLTEHMDPLSEPGTGTGDDNGTGTDSQDLSSCEEVPGDESVSTDSTGTDDLSVQDPGIAGGGEVTEEEEPAGEQEGELPAEEGKEEPSQEITGSPEGDTGTVTPSGENLETLADTTMVTEEIPDITGETVTEQISSLCGDEASVFWGDPVIDFTSYNPTTADTTPSATNANLKYNDAYGFGWVDAGKDGDKSNDYYQIGRSDGTFDTTWGNIFTLQSSITTSASCAIRIQAAGVYLDGNGKTITGTGTGESVGVGITAEGDGSVVTNFGKIEGFYMGIASDADDVTISGNTISKGERTDPTNGIISHGTGAMISDNQIGVKCVGIAAVEGGTGYTITGNTITGGNYGINSNAQNGVIDQNTISGSLAGMQLYADNGGDGIQVTGNTVSGCEAGIGLMEGTGYTVTGNTIKDTNGNGIVIAGGSGTVYDNYLANSNNVEGGQTAINGYTWTNPEGRTAGTNVMGGPNIAGNYWSNGEGTGWSDTHAISDTGYTTDPYEIVSGTGIYDTAPLVRTSEPTPDPTPDPTPEPTPDPTPVPPAGGTADDGTSTQSIPRTVPPGIVITSVIIPPGATAGGTTTLTLTFDQEGTPPVPPDASYLFVPLNEAARDIGEFTATSANGEFNEVTLSLAIPLLPGVYVYEFQPYEIQTDPLTGEEVPVPVGGPVAFIVTVAEDGSVTVTLRGISE